MARRYPTIDAECWVFDLDNTLLAVLLSAFLQVPRAGWDAVKRFAAETATDS